jgi:hypothetical protein
MFPVLFPGIFTFVKSYMKLGILSILIVSLTGFISYHYVVITRYEKKFDKMDKALKVCEADRENWIKRGFYSQDSIDKITDYYEKEITKLKNQIKRDGELTDNEILKNVIPSKPK